MSAQCPKNNNSVGETPKISNKKNPPAAATGLKATGTNLEVTVNQQVMERLQAEKAAALKPHEATANKGVMITNKRCSSSNRNSIASIWKCIQIITQVPQDDIMDSDGKVAEVGMICCNLCGKFWTEKIAKRDVLQHFKKRHKHLETWIENGCKDKKVSEVKNVFRRI